MARKVYVSCLKQVYCEGCLVLVVFTLALYSAVLARNLVFLPSCGLGQHYQDFGHGFSLYGLPNWHITYIHESNQNIPGHIQPRSQGPHLTAHWSERGETLAHAGHVSPRIWEMTFKLLKGWVA